MAPNEKILTIDVGGSHIKSIILDSQGQPLSGYRRLPTPPHSAPADVIRTILELEKDSTDYDRISVGFPGYVRNGVVYTAPNLGKGLWENIDLGQQISDALGKPVRLVNDADQLGLGVVSGRGFELAVTLGTGVGTAVLIDGYLLPHLELAHHPLKKNVDYDAYIGERAMREEGKEKWNKRVERVLGVLKTVFNYDRLYLGGGGVSHLSFALGRDIITFTNQDGIKGGAKLWELEEKHHITTNYPRNAVS